MEDINSAIEYFGMFSVIIAGVLLVFFFFLTFMDHAFVFWVLIVLAIITSIIFNVFDLFQNETILSYSFLFGMSCLAGYAFATPILLLISAFSFGEAIRRKIDS